MFKKKTILIALLATTTMANAAEYSQKSDVGFYGKIDYDVSGDHVDGRDELGGSYINFYTKYQTKEHIFINLDAGAKNKSEVFGDGSDWNFDLNNLNIEYHDYETNTYAVIGRQFTPIGINYHDPLKESRIFETDNPVSATVDALNVVFEDTVQGVDMKVSAFIGTRFDDAPITTSYGANLKVGSLTTGYFNFGYMNNKIDGDINFNDGNGGTSKTDNVDSINLAYMYDNHNVIFLADYNNIQLDDSIDDISSLKAKLGYQFGAILPYLTYEDNSYYPSENELSSVLDYAETESYGFGMEYKFPKIMTLGAEVAYQEIKTTSSPKDDETIVKVFAKVNF